MPPMQGTPGGHTVQAAPHIFGFVNVDAAVAQDEPQNTIGSPWQPPPQKYGRLPVQISTHWHVLGSSRCPTRPLY
jgi:hypothetical protein